MHALATLAQFYGVTTDYLLGLTENKHAPSADIQSLHLNDDMVELLSSGRINNRLLCELVLHPDFIQLLTDIEISVDRIADMRINDLNQILELTRQSVIEKYSPDENDLHTRTLQLAQISEDIFYSHVIHKDLDAIVKDIRTAHQQDHSTADADTQASATVEEVQEMLDKATQYQGTLNQKRAYLICEMLHVDYDKLPQDEQEALSRISRKSPLMTSAISQRSKSASFPKQSSGKKNRKK